ncbi:MAG: (E)-4-hydroxy-3-methylbut-2-enyl-diphosphate synthase [Candidatus Eisenbacteria sp.]|nr:(E)-4-hydroxy-3-methylbut-2-enyl-diphosphate synthase [Candidatus Eisenbacteria bacterium]
MVARRRISDPVQVGDIVVGGDYPIVIQSMTTTDPADLEGSCAQIEALAEAGCRLIRLAVPSRRAAKALAPLRERLNARAPSVALIADVHFDPRIAFDAAPHVAKVRINPGNFASSEEEVRRRLPALLDELNRYATALRIGVNHGSLAPYVTALHGHGPTAMAVSALDYLEICRAHGFTRVLVSLKASNPAIMVAANRLIAARMEATGLRMPIHLGVTEAGEGDEGALRSAVGIGTLLLDGIGDTIRVSLTGHPAGEIPVCREILAAVERLGGVGSANVGSANADGREVRSTGDAAQPSGGKTPSRPDPPATSWRGIPLGGTHPPRIELVSTPPSPRGPDECLAALEIGRRHEPPIESLVLHPPVIADGAAGRALHDRWLRLREGLPAAVPIWLAVDQRQPFWQELWQAPNADRSRLAEAEGFLSGELLGAIDGLVLHVPGEGRASLLSRDGSAPARTETPTPALSPAALPEKALTHFLELLASRLTGGADGSSPSGLLRWHLRVPDAAARSDDAAPGAGESIDRALTAWAQAARRLRQLSLAAGWKEPAFSWEGKNLVAGGRALALALWTSCEQDPEQAQRPLLIARLPADRWEAVLGLGALLLDHLADAVMIPPAMSRGTPPSPFREASPPSLTEASPPSPTEASPPSLTEAPPPSLTTETAAGLQITREILQATRRRLSHVEFISCPGCGRLHFDLESTVRRLKSKLGHLPAVKIAVMGCSVNGPGEMADADFGYVGAGPQTVDLYVGRRRAQRDLTPEAADSALLALLRDRGLIPINGDDPARTP